MKANYVLGVLERERLMLAKELGRIISGRSKSRRSKETNTAIQIIQSRLKELRETMELIHLWQKPITSQK